MEANDVRAPGAGTKLRRPQRAVGRALSATDGRVSAVIEIGRKTFGRRGKRPLREVR